MVLFPSHVLSLSDLSFRQLRLRNRRLRMEGIAKIDVSWKSFLKNSRMFFNVFLKPWEPFF